MPIQSIALSPKIKPFEMYRFYRLKAVREKLHRATRKSSQRRSAEGFSMPEALVSGFILMLFVGNSAQLMGTTGSTISKASLREIGNTLIAEDLNTLRREAILWACLPGTACTGNPNDYNSPAAYRTEDVEEITYQNYCTNRATALGMVNESDVLQKGGYRRHDSGTNNVISNGPIKWTLSNHSSISSFNASKQLNIVRTIEVNQSDKNQVHISYKTSSNSPISLHLEAVIIPTAMSRCL